MSEYTVQIKFKHINHAKAWVAKWRGFADNDTLANIIDQVEASFPREPVVGNRVTVTKDAMHYATGTLRGYANDDDYVIEFDTGELPVVVPPSLPWKVMVRR